MVPCGCLPEGAAAGTGLSEVGLQLLYVQTSYGVGKAHMCRQSAQEVAMHGRAAPALAAAVCGTGGGRCGCCGGDGAGAGAGRRCAAAAAAAAEYVQSLTPVQIRGILLVLTVQIVQMVVLMCSCVAMVWLVPHAARTSQQGPHPVHLAPSAAG